MESSPQLKVTIVSIFVTCLIGFTLGAIMAWDLQGTAVANRKYYITVGILVGYFAGRELAGWILKRLEEYQYHEYGATASSWPPMQSVEAASTSRYLDLQLWTDKTHSSWVRLGVTDEQWRSMAVSAHNAQEFSTDVIDRKIYGKLKKRFEDTGIIIKKGSGYELTRAGKSLVKMLATLPYPYDEEPELVKQLDNTPTPSPAREQA